MPYRPGLIDDILEDAPLGAAPDEVIGEMYGLSADLIKRRRIKMGIPPCDFQAWSEVEDEAQTAAKLLAGKIRTDHVVGKRRWITAPVYASDFEISCALDTRSHWLGNVKILKRTGRYVWVEVDPCTP